MAYAYFGYEGEAFSQGGYLFRGFNVCAGCPMYRGRQRTRVDRLSAMANRTERRRCGRDFGSGAGGGTLAHELTRRGIKVVLFEAGDANRWRASRRSRARLSAS